MERRSWDAFGIESLWVTIVYHGRTVKAFRTFVCVHSTEFHRLVWQSSSSSSSSSEKLIVQVVVDVLYFTQPAASAIMNGKHPYAYLDILLLSLHACLVLQLLQIG